MPNHQCKVTVKNGERCSFWTDKWINGKTNENFAPHVYQAINAATRAKRMVPKQFLIVVIGLATHRHNKTPPHSVFHASA
jgi:hypothetical protein